MRKVVIDYSSNLLKPGTVVSIPVLVFWNHKGIVSDRWHNSKPMVISNSARRGGVQEEPWDDFACGCRVSVEGYPSNLQSFMVLARAREFMGTAYDLVKWNCELLVAHAHGLKVQSPQLAITAIIALVLGAIALR